METGRSILKYTIFILIIVNLSSQVVLLVKSQPKVYTLVYSAPRAYGVDWMDVKAVYIKTEENRLYFYIEYYGSIPSSRDHERVPRIYMDVDRNSQTGRSSQGLGLDYYISLVTNGDDSGFWIGLFRWNSTTSSWKNIRSLNEVDLKLGATRAPGLSYVEVWVDQQDVGYTPRGIAFYVNAGSRIVGMISITDLSYVVGSSVRQIAVDGEAGDWGTMTPLTTFPSRSINPPEFEVSSIYVANDDGNLYVRLDTRGTPTKAINDGVLTRRFSAYLDTDNNDDTGYERYGGAEYYIDVGFATNSSGKSTFVDFYRYTGTGSDYKWDIVSKLPSSSDFNNILEFKIPLSVLGIGSGGRVGLYMGGSGIFSRDTPGLTYPPVVADTTPPVTTITIGSPKYLSDAKTFVSGSTVFKLSASDDASGVGETRYRIDGGSWSTYTAGFTLSAFSDGSHTIGYYSADRSNNNEAEKTLFVVLDKTPPTVSGLSAPSNPVFGESPTLTCDVSDVLSGIKEVKLYYSTNSGASWTEVTMSPQAGRYASSIPSQIPFTSVQYYVKAVDNVGNEYQTPTSTFSVGIPMWLYIAVIAIVVILAAALLLRRRKPTPQSTYVPPPPPPA